MEMETTKQRVARESLLADAISAGSLSQPKPINENLKSPSKSPVRTPIKNPAKSPVIRGPSQPVSDDRLAKIFNEPRIKVGDFSTVKPSFRGGSVKKPSADRVLFLSWVAAFIDFLIVFALTSLFVVVFSMVVKSSFQQLVSIFKGSVLLFLMSVVIASSVFYIVTLRSFLGYTIGEWACGLRLGSPKQRFSSWYSAQVIARALFVFGTGVITLPFLSMIFGLDIAGKLCGLSVVSIQENP